MTREQLDTAQKLLDKIDECDDALNSLIFGNESKGVYIVKVTNVDTATRVKIRNAIQERKEELEKQFKNL